MSDSYQPIYDATMNALREAGVSRYVGILVRDVQEAIRETARPSVLYRPALSLDGNKWCALYGFDLQDGVAGFGDSPAAAMVAFDAAWNAKVTP